MFWLVWNLPLLVTKPICWIQCSYKSFQSNPKPAIFQHIKYSLKKITQIKTRKQLKRPLLLSTDLEWRQAFLTCRSQTPRSVWSVSVWVDISWRGQAAKCFKLIYHDAVYCKGTWNRLYFDMSLMGERILPCFGLCAEEQWPRAR